MFRNPNAEVWYWRHGVPQPGLTALKGAIGRLPLGATGNTTLRNAGDTNAGLGPNGARACAGPSACFGGTMKVTARGGAITLVSSGNGQSGDPVQPMTETVAGTSRDVVTSE